MRDILLLTAIGLLLYTASTHSLSFLKLPRVIRDARAMLKVVGVFYICIGTLSWLIFLMTGALL